MLVTTSGYGLGLLMVTVMVAVPPGYNAAPVVSLAIVEFVCTVAVADPLPDPVASHEASAALSATRMPTNTIVTTKTLPSFFILLSFAC